MKKTYRYSLLFVILPAVVMNAQWQITFGPSGFAYTRVTCFAQSGTDYYCGTHNDGIWKSADNSSSPWTKVSNDVVGKNISALFVHGLDIYAASDSGLFKSTTNGANWTKLAVGTSFIICLAAIGENLFAGGSGIYLSSDGGETWNPRYEGLVPPSVSSLAVVGTKLFAGTFGGGVFISENNGSNWTSSSKGLDNNNISELASNGSHLFAVTSQFPNSNVFVSSDNGANWNSSNNGLPTSTEVHFAVTDGNIFAANYNYGVFLTRDNGGNWIEVNEGFGTSRTIRSLGVLGGDLFCGFYQFDVRRRALSEMITAVKTNSVVIPNEFILEQNYPNPFNPSTKISYSLPEKSQVILKIYDMIGNEIATLVNEEKSPGSYSIDFKASDLASGIYFYQLKAFSTDGDGSEFKETKKMIFTK